MAKKDTTSEKVTRVTASASTKGKKKSAKIAEPKAKQATTTKNKQTPVVDSTEKKGGILAIPRSLLNYFKGSWRELKQVHWPTRSTTWALTFAVLMFTAFFAALVLLLDAGFKYLFEQILG